jgi:hypothetical protein
VEGKERFWMMALEWVLSRLSLRGERCACSPAPTNATSDVQKSIRARLLARSRQEVERKEIDEGRAAGWAISLEAANKS